MTELQFEAIVEDNTQFVWKRALLLSKGDTEVAKEHATNMFVSMWKQMQLGTYKSVVLSVMEYIREELAAQNQVC